MQTPIPEKMNAAALEHFGGPEVLEPKALPTPKPAGDQVLIEVTTAGVGEWDPAVREGQLELGGPGGFPRVIGNDGSGRVVAVGEKVRRFQVGDAVYAYTMEGGLYAEYAAIPEDHVATLPKGIRVEDAGALGADGITAVIGLEEVLQLKPGETIVIFGASGGIGHLAVQLAKRMGAKVLGVASGEDGVALVRQLGADAVVEGHAKDWPERLHAAAPHGATAALILAGNGADRVFEVLQKGARVAHPNGVEPVPKSAGGIQVQGYDGEPSPEAFERLNHWIGSGPFQVKIGRSFPLDQAAQAHREVEKHHLGKLALRVR